MNCALLIADLCYTAMNLNVWLNCKKKTWQHTLINEDNNKGSDEILDKNKRKRIPKGQSKMVNQENTEGAIKNGQSRESGNIGYKRRRKI